MCTLKCAVATSVICWTSLCFIGRCPDMPATIILVNCGPYDGLSCLPAVTTSVNGLNALALLRSQPNHFDLVLSDVVMPGE